MKLKMRFLYHEQNKWGTLFEVVDSWGQFNARVNLICGPLEYLFEEQRHRLLKVIECARQIVQALLYMHEEKG